MYPPASCLSSSLPSLGLDIYAQGLTLYRPPFSSALEWALLYNFTPELFKWVSLVLFAAAASHMLIGASSLKLTFLSLS